MQLHFLLRMSALIYLNLSTSNLNSFCQSVNLSYSCSMIVHIARKPFAKNIRLASLVSLSVCPLVKTSDRGTLNRLQIFDSDYIISHRLSVLLDLVKRHFIYLEPCRKCQDSPCYLESHFRNILAVIVFTDFGFSCRCFYILPFTKAKPCQHRSGGRKISCSEIFNDGL